jgi:hypothetical protein
MKTVFTKIALALLISTGLLEASNPKADYKKLQTHIDELNRMSAQYNQSNDKNKIDQLISNLETFTQRKMSILEKKFIKAEFAQMETMPYAELSPKEIRFYDETDSKKELFLSMQIVNAEKNIFKFNNVVFELNPNKTIQENLKVLVNGLLAAAN